MVPGQPYLTGKRVLRGAEEACWAHNPKVVGSKPTAARTLLEPHCLPSINLVTPSASQTTLGWVKTSFKSSETTQEEREENRLEQGHFEILYFQSEYCFFGESAEVGGSHGTQTVHLLEVLVVSLYM